MKKRPNMPFPPARTPFFYGWIVLIAGTIGILMSIPGQTMGVSVFTENLIRDLHISRDNLSLAYLIGTLGSGFLITRAGKLYDKHGARIMTFFSGIFLGITLIYLTRVDSISDLFQHRFSWSESITTIVLLTIGFFGIRFFGQGLLTMVSRNMVMKWFVERRGLANAVLGMFSAFGFALAPKLLNVFIENLEWRGAWTLSATIVGVFFSIFVFILYRDNPAECGLQADGNKPVRLKKKRPPSLPKKDYSLKEARKTIAFWAFTMGLALVALYISGLTFHIVSVFETSGLTEAKGIGIFLPTSVIAVIVQFGISSASDYMRLKYLLAVFMLSVIITTLGLISLGTSELAYWMIISGNGIAWGLYTVLIAVAFPRFYGLKNLGAISGYSLSFIVIGSAFGPYLFSLSKKISGAYDLVGWLCLLFALGILLASMKADNPNKGQA